MSTALQDYLDRLRSAGNVEQLTQALDFGAHSFGAPLFAYLAFPTSIGARPRLITNYPPAWRAHYFARRYETSDPVVHRFQRQPHPFYWGADDAGDDPFDQMFYGEADDFGISYGYTVPMRFWHGRYAAMTFASDIRNLAARERIHRSSLGLEAIAMTFHLQVCATFETTHQIGHAILTPREVQCLTWASRGKTYIEIGEILEISARTVAAHIENAKRKLGVAKLHEAIVILALSGKL
jgi:DNA-binding CsgD family transcriptional regulator